MKQKLLKSIIIILIMFALTFGYIKFSEYHTLKPVVSSSNKCIAVAENLKSRVDSMGLTVAEVDEFNKTIDTALNIHKYNLNYLKNQIVGTKYISDEDKQKIATYKDASTDEILKEFSNCQDILLEHMDILEKIKK